MRNLGKLLLSTLVVLALVSPVLAQSPRLEANVTAITLKTTANGQARFFELTMTMVQLKKAGSDAGGKYYMLVENLSEEDIDQFAAFLDEATAEDVKQLAYRIKTTRIQDLQKQRRWWEGLKDIEAPPAPPGASKTVSLNENGLRRQMELIHNLVGASVGTHGTLMATTLDLNEYIEFLNQASEEDIRRLAHRLNTTPIEELRRERKWWVVPKDAQAPSSAASPPAPEVVVLEPGAGAQVAGEKVTVRGIAMDARAVVAVRVAGQVAAMLPRSERAMEFWVEDVPLQAGENNIEIVAKNVDGAEGRTTVKVRRVEAAAEPAASVGLTLEQVLKLLGAGVTPARIATIVKERGVSFELTEDAESKLRALGATDTLLLAIAKAKK